MPSSSVPEARRKKCSLFRGREDALSFGAGDLSLVLRLVMPLHDTIGDDVDEAANSKEEEPTGAEEGGSIGRSEDGAVRCAGRESAGGA